MEALLLDCAGRRLQLMRDPLDSCTTSHCAAASVIFPLGVRVVRFTARSLEQRGFNSHLAGAPDRGLLGSNPSRTPSSPRL